MDQGAKIIILKDAREAKHFSKINLLGEKLRRTLLERRAELISEELDEILMKLAEEEN